MNRKSVAYCIHDRQDLSVQVVDIIPGRLVFMALSSANSYTKLKKKPQYVYYSVDDEYVSTWTPLEFKELG